MNTTEHAAAIRAELKARGWNGRMVSVKAKSFSMGSSIEVTVRDAAVPLRAVETIANAHERIDRDQFGDILAGCNRYVRTSYSLEVSELLTERYLPAVEAAAAAASLQTDRLITVNGTEFMVQQQFNGLHVWDKNSHQAHCVDTRGAANWIGQTIAGGAA